jgi:hypothetical protein
MKLNGIVKGASIAALFLLAGQANAATVNLNAGDPLNGVELNLAAGTYEVTPTDDPNLAWNAWSSGGAVRGCDTNGENCSQGFIHQYSITIAGLTTLVANGGRYQTAQMAFDNASSFVFSIAQDQIVSFRIADINYGDNFGGVSLNVNAVPLPAAAWLFLSAIGGMAGFKRLRRTSNVSLTA